jgi:hypothetical protein
MNEFKVIASRAYTGPLYVKMNSSLRFASKKSNDVDPLETPYMGSTLDLIHGQLHPFHGTE